MRSKEKRSFKLGFWLLSRLVNRRKNYGLFGDMEEIYNMRVTEKSRVKAAWTDPVESLRYE